MISQYLAILTNDRAVFNNLSLQIWPMTGRVSGGDRCGHEAQQPGPGDQWEHGIWSRDHNIHLWLAQLSFPFAETALSALQQYHQQAADYVQLAIGGLMLVTRCYLRYFLQQEVQNIVKLWWNLVRKILFLLQEKVKLLLLVLQNFLH